MQATHFKIESAEKTIVFTMARMLGVIAAGDYAGFHDYVRDSATTHFDYTIPPWFSAMVMWVCKQSYAPGVVSGAAVLSSIDITGAKTQMYEILDDNVDDNFRNAWKLMPGGTIITIPAPIPIEDAVAAAAVVAVAVVAAAAGRPVRARAAPAAALVAAPAGSDVAAARAGAASATPVSRRRPRAASPATGPCAKLGKRRGGGGDGAGGGGAGCV